jgi:hypothetical protein
MNLFVGAQRRSEALFRPVHLINRWLLSHWPMVWSERYHVALVAATAAATAAILLGFAQGATVSYALSRLPDIPLQSALWGAPFCIAGFWFSRRAKGYNLLPITKIHNGVFFGLLDIGVTFVLVDWH